MHSGLHWGESWANLLRAGAGRSRKPPGARELMDHGKALAGAEPSQKNNGGGIALRFRPTSTGDRHHASVLGRPDGVFRVVQRLFQAREPHSSRLGLGRPMAVTVVGVSGSGSGDNPRSEGVGGHLSQLLGLGRPKRSISLVTLSGRDSSTWGFLCDRGAGLSEGGGRCSAKRGGAARRGGGDVPRDPSVVHLLGGGFLTAPGGVLGRCFLSAGLRFTSAGKNGVFEFKRDHAASLRRNRGTHHELVTNDRGGLSNSDGRPEHQRVGYGSSNSGTFSIPLAPPLGRQAWGNHPSFTGVQVRAGLAFRRCCLNPVGADRVKNRACGECEG